MDIEYVETSIGWMEIAGDKLGVHSVRFANEPPGLAAGGSSEPAVRCADWLKRYFAGDMAEPAGFSFFVHGTPFRQDVLRRVCAIPAGQTCGYGKVAEHLLLPKAARAVGRAVALNRLAIVVPCHRVTGKDGALTGFAWGVWRKEWLLEHERRYARKPQ